MASNADHVKSATIHLACRSDNPSKLISYQVGENEKPVIVRILINDKIFFRFINFQQINSIRDHIYPDTN